MRLAVSGNEDQVLREMDAFADDAEKLALPRALNRLRDQAQVAGLRRIAEVYDIGPRTSEKYLSIKLASIAELRASITAKGAGFPLYVMAPRKTPRGISVKVKGRRFVIPGTFLATMPNGHVGVFGRGAYAGKGGTALRETHSFGRFVFGKGRRVRKPGRRGTSELPINELYTFGPAETLSNQDVTEAMNDRVDEQYGKVIAAEIRFARR